MVESVVATHMDCWSGVVTTLSTEYCSSHTKTCLSVCFKSVKYTLLSRPPEIT